MTATPAPTTRASLLLRLRDSRDHDAWVEFVEIYEPAVYRYLRRCGLQDADARELVQELLLAVSRHIGRWELDKSRGSFRGWLGKVTRNLVINWRKHGQRRAASLGSAESSAVFEDILADECAESAEFDRDLRRAVFQRGAEAVRQEQSHKAWRAFWETAVEGKAAADVARELAMTAGGVRVAKCRVLARIKELVAEWERES